MSVAHVEEPEVGVIDLDEESGGLCRSLPGACEFVSCRHNIATEATWGGHGRTMGRRTDRKLAILADVGRCTCVLELASKEHSVEEITDALGVNRQTVYNAIQSGVSALQSIPHDVLRKFGLRSVPSEGWTSPSETSKPAPRPRSSGTESNSASVSESPPSSEKKADS
jgi:hypothetical protein